MTTRLTTTQTFCYLAPLAMAGAIAMDIYIPALPTIVDDLQGNAHQGQLTLSIFAYGFGCGQLIFGPISDRVGRKPVAMAALWLFVIGSLCCALAQNMSALIVFRLLQALGASACYMISLAIVRDLFSGATATMVYSRIHATIGIAPMLAPLIGASLLQVTNSWQASFYCICMLTLAVLIFIQRKLPETLQSNQQTLLSTLAGNYVTIMKHRQFIVYGCASATTLISLFLYCAISPYILIVKFAVTPMTFGFIFGLNAITWTIASWCSPYWLARYTEKQVITTALQVILAASLLMVFQDLGDTMTAGSFIINMMLISFAVGTMMGPAAANTLKPFAAMAGTASSVLGSLQFTLAGLIGQFTISEHTQHCYPLSIALVISSLVTLMLLYLFHKNEPHEQNYDKG